MNVKKNTRLTSSLLRAISPAPRMRILLALGHGEACVCHLEAALGWRQAYISQHLMALRNAGVLTSRRESRFVYYRLRDPRVLELIRIAAELQEVELMHIPSPEACVCPTCSTDEILGPAAAEKASDPP